MFVTVIKESIQCPEGKFFPGDTLKISDEEGQLLISRGVVIESPPISSVSPEIAAIEKVIANGNVTKSGKPEVEALELELNRELSAKDRDEMFVEYQKNQKE